MIPPQENPFRVDRVSTLPFLGGDVPALIERFLRLNRAAIVGPHGVGKSTLLRAIGDALSQAGHRVLCLSLPGSANAFERRNVLKQLRTAGDAVVLFDGYEQLGWFRRRSVLKHPRVLVTAHAPTRLPTLITLAPTVSTLDTVLDQLLPNPDEQLRTLARAAFARHQGDVRATLFDLYDAAGSGPLPRGTGRGDQKESSPRDDDGGGVVV